MSSTTVLSPAKINLLLKVLGKRDDGYHDIFSVMVPVSLFDQISIDAEDGHGITLECPCAGVPEDEANLAYRAAEAFLETTGLKRSVSIRIAKKIPVGAGLGGGSSDAASVLMALDSVVGTNLGEKTLMGIGARLGSDVPFFMLKGPAVARGRGEVLGRIKLPPLSYILVNPGFEVSTRWAYNNLTLTKGYEDNILTYSEDSFRDIVYIKDSLVNDLEEVVIGKHPEIQELKRDLLRNGAFGALMSGSGPTVFGVFSSERVAERAFGVLKKRLDKRFSVFLTHGLGGA